MRSPSARRAAKAISPSRTMISSGICKLFWPSHGSTLCHCSRKDLPTPSGSARRFGCAPTTPGLVSGYSRISSTMCSPSPKDASANPVSISFQMLGPPLTTPLRTRFSDTATCSVSSDCLRSARLISTRRIRNSSSLTMASSSYRCSTPRRNCQTSTLPVYRH
ncbi:hypothetical protein FQZ97_1031020 [compost metagenome]